MNLMLLSKKEHAFYLILARQVVILLLLISIKINLLAQTPDLYITSFQNDAIGRFDGENGSYLGNFSSGYTLASPTKMILNPLMSQSAT